MNADSRAESLDFSCESPRHLSCPAPGTEVMPMRVGLGVCGCVAALSLDGPAPACGACGRGKHPRALRRQPSVRAHSAQAGDVILLQAGATYTGNYVPPAKSGATMITVQTEIAETGALAPGVRLSPAAAGPLARLKSPNTIAALRTNAGAHHWRLQLLQFAPNQDGYR